MPEVTFRFHGELDYFLPPEHRETQFEQPVGPTDTVKHVVESIGIPHTEIGAVTANGKPANLSDQLKGGDSVEVLPHHLPIHLPQRRFVVDGHVGRLAAYLRMLGFDTCYDRYADDAQLASIAKNENRCLLTRDVGLLKRREVETGYCVRSDQPHQQLREVTTRFALHSHFQPFVRCMECNGPLCPVPKQQVFDQLPPHTRATKDDFSRCQNCGKIFWRGSHRECHSTNEFMTKANVTYWCRQIAGWVLTES
jgi:uncharacterized protein with PIN domain